MASSEPDNEPPLSPTDQAAVLRNILQALRPPPPLHSVASTSRADPFSLASLLPLAEAGSATARALADSKALGQRALALADAGDPAGVDLLSEALWPHDFLHSFLPHQVPRLLAAARARLASDPLDARAAHVAAHLEIAVNGDAAAARRLVASNALCEKLPALHFLRALEKTLSGRTVDSIPDFSAIIAQGEEVAALGDAYLYRGRARSFAGNFRGAAEDLRHFLSHAAVDSRKRPEAFFWLSSVLHSAGDLAGGARAYRSGLLAERRKLPCFLGDHPLAVKAAGEAEYGFTLKQWCSAAGCSKTADDVCARCRVARYCSKACQKADWGEGGHKRECVAPPA